MQPASGGEADFEVRVGSDVRGPVSLEQIRLGAEAGKLPASTEVRRVGTDEWLPLSAVLSRDVPAAPAAVAPAAPAPAASSRATRRRWLLPAAVAGALAVIGGGAVVAWRLARSGHAAFPIAANRLPENTDALREAPIDGAYAANRTVREMLVAGAISAFACEPDEDDPASALLDLGGDDEKALAYFAPSHENEVRAMMDCGGRMAAGLLGPARIMGFNFTSADNKKHTFAVLDLRAARLPSALGWVDHMFSALPGYCYQPKGQKDCGDDSPGAVRYGGRWIFSDAATLKTLAHSLAQPKAIVSSTVEMLQHATHALSGMQSWSAEATRSSKTHLVGPCAWAASNVAGSSSDFMSACFPAADDRQVATIDGEVRAAADEVDADVKSAQAVRGRVVLVARDSEAAADLEKDVAELVNDWKAHVENNQAKLVKLASEGAKTPDERVWAVVVDVFIRALENMRVSRSGSAVTISYERRFTSEVEKEVKEAAGKPDDRGLAAAAVLAAIEKRQPLPPEALSQVLGARVAAFVLSPGLGLDAAEFRKRWDAWLDQAGANGALALADTPLAEAGADGKFALKLAPEALRGASVTLSGVVDERSGAIEKASITKRCSASTLPLASAVDVVGCRALVQAATPGADVDALFKKLGMKDGTSTSVVQGDVRYSYSSSPDGHTETFAASPVSMGARRAAAATAPSASAAPTASAAAAAPPGMILIPAGTFTMGSDDGKPFERPARRVTITKPFHIDRLEVTAGEYQQCVSAGSCTPSSIHGPSATPESIATQSGLCTARDPAKANYPINCIDRSQAEAYCKFAGKRLPTEAEWEYAARGTDGRVFPWGAKANGCTEAIIGGCLKGPGVAGSHPAGASPFGALDMAGNVWEWVSDTWTDNPASLGTTDPRAPPGGALGVLRGGSWDFSAPSAQTFSRLKFSAASGHVSTGVRCAK
jgi:formylglycine-generating enzyme required for sulfatase activity